MTGPCCLDGKGVRSGKRHLRSALAERRLRGCAGEYRTIRIWAYYSKIRSRPRMGTRLRKRSSVTHFVNFSSATVIKSDQRSPSRAICASNIAHNEPPKVIGPFSLSSLPGSRYVPTNIDRIGRGMETIHGTARCQHPWMVCQLFTARWHESNAARPPRSVAVADRSTQHARGRDPECHRLKPPRGEIRSGDTLAGGYI
jgi:hypothetical protein